MKSLSEIRGIVRAVEDRKPDEARRLCAEHVQNAAIAAYAVIDARTHQEAQLSK
jgi:DNA-binding GntR family transcriptional regulator